MRIEKNYAGSFLAKSNSKIDFEKHSHWYPTEGSSYVVLDQSGAKAGITILRSQNGGVPSFFKILEVGDFLRFISELDNAIHYLDRLDNGSLDVPKEDMRALIIKSVIDDFQDKFEFSQSSSGEYSILESYFPRSKMKWEMDDVYISAEKSTVDLNEISKRKLYGVRFVNDENPKIRLTTQRGGKLEDMQIARSKRKP